MLSFTKNRDQPRNRQVYLTTPLDVTFTGVQVCLTTPADPLKIENIYNRQKSAQIKADKTNIMLRRMIVLQDRTPLPAYRV